jgi:hypothetical protein
MPDTPSIEGKLTLRTGLPAEDLDPTRVCLRTEVLLAQAETLGRLRRKSDQDRKLMWTFAVAYDSYALHPNSFLAVLNAARIARIAGQFDLAAKLIHAGRNLDLDENAMRSIAVEESRLDRERDIDAAGSRERMALQLIIYSCQCCGRLKEYISIPCIFCGWQPLTLTEVAQSGRLSTPWFSLWDLLAIGRQVASGRNAIEVVANLTESAKASMDHPSYRRYAEDALEEAKGKKADRFFYYLHAFSCQNCGAKFARHDPFVTSCNHCQTKLRIPPPFRLLSCLSRVSVHFQNNFGGDQTQEADLFIRYLVSLQSKLFRNQETPNPAERGRLVELLTSMGTIKVVNNLGTLDVSDPRKVIASYGINDADADNRARGIAAVDDFRNTLQLLADWMFKTKALC